MRAPKSGAAIAVGLACLLFAVPGHIAMAQSDSTCNPCLVLKEGGLEARGQDVLARFAPEIARAEWGQVAQRLAADFRGSRVVPPGRERRVLQAELDTMAAELVTVERSGDAAVLVARARGVRQTRFVLDYGDEVGQAVVFAGSPNEFVIDCGTMTLEARRDLCERVFDARRLLVKYGAQGRERALNALQRCVELWGNFNDCGYSMLPWELAVNGWWAFKPGSLTPPAWQLILAHPALGLEVGRPGSALRRLEVGTIEPIGLVLYQEDRRSYVGASTLVSLPSGQDVGYGGMVHLGRTVQAGYVWRQDRAQSGVVLSADLYQLFAQAPDLLRDAKGRIVAFRDSLAARR